MSSKRYITPFRRQVLLCLCTGLIPTIICLLLLWLGDYDQLALLTISIILAFTLIAFPSALYASTRNQWQVVSNILASFREGDFSLRTHDTQKDDPISETMREINLLEDTLKSQRLNYIERQNLLIKILREVDIAIFCIDSSNRVTLANHYAADLFASNPENVIGQSTSDLKLDQIIEAGSLKAMEIAFPNRQSRWLVKQGHYREQGEPQRLVILADLGQTLREEELTAWKRLIRVIAHELNNSMTPVKSMTQTLSKIISKDPLPDDWREDVSEGLSVIGNRVENLNRFVTDYSRVARMPAPAPASVDLSTLVNRLAILDSRKNVTVIGGPECLLLADEAQIEQAFINLTKNAIDSVDATDGDVSIKWSTDSKFALIEILDEGQGLAGEDNLFVPYFTTKPSGTGVGLFLSRQIIEAHGGSLSLENRGDRQGCVAKIKLPLV